MTTAELIDVIEWIEDRYGTNPRWKKATALIDDFHPYTKGAAMEAALDLYRSGAQRINPSDLIGLTARTWRNRVDAGIDAAPEQRDCTGRHVWALAFDYEHDLEFAGESMGYDECVLCHVTRPSKPRQPAV